MNTQCPCTCHESGPPSLHMGGGKCPCKLKSETPKVTQTKTVPLVYYDEDNVRHVVGEAEVEIKNGEIIAEGKITEDFFGMQGVTTRQALLGLPNLVGISFGPDDARVITEPVKPFEPSLAEKAAMRLGPLGRGTKDHITDKNPNGEVRQCDRRDIHKPHEYQADFGAYFDVYCPGNQGDKP